MVPEYIGRVGRVVVAAGRFETRGAYQREDVGDRELATAIDDSHIIHVGDGEVCLHIGLGTVRCFYTDVSFEEKGISEDRRGDATGKPK